MAYAGDGGSDEGEDHHLLYAFDVQGNYDFPDDFVHDDGQRSCDVVLDSFVGRVNARSAAAQQASRSARADEAPTSDGSSRPRPSATPSRCASTTGR